MKKSKKLIILLSILAILLGAVIFFAMIQPTRLTSEERIWINDNEKKVQNIYILNDTNLFGNNGIGVYYSFIDKFAKEYNFTLNPITITNEEQPSNLALMVGNSLPSNALSFYTDHYVLIGKNNEMIYDLNTLSSKKIGVLASNYEYAKKYIMSNNITLEPYKTREELVKSIDNNEMSYILVPRMEYLDSLLIKKYWINYHVSDMTRVYYISDSSNSMLFQIMKKYYAGWKVDNLTTVIQDQEIALFKDKLDITDSELDNLRKKTIKYGYKNYLPYEVYGDGTYGGIVAKELKSFAKLTKLDIQYVKYSKDEKLIKDINAGKISMYTNFYNLNSNGSSWNDIATGIPMEVGVYSSVTNPIIVSSLETLKQQSLYMEEKSVLMERMNTGNNYQIVTFQINNINKILKDKLKLIALDKNVGDYLTRNILNDYVLRYTLPLNSSYSLKSNNEEVFNKLLIRYLNYMDGKSMAVEGINDAISVNNKGSFISNVATYILYFVLIVVLVLIMIYRSSKRVKLQKKIKKEDKLKFVDHLTSLKNRNYLNENISAWNKNTIYPQCVVMIDLNKIQEINDKEGYENGDRQICAAANILIKTQLDNTDIIRTNGNEFMIYMIDYNQKQIASYIHKLTKEFKDLPYDYGECISYSMIENNLKLIEDAINECVEDIKKQKEDVK